MQFKEGHIGEYTNLAEEACAAGFHRAMVHAYLVFQIKSSESRIF